MGVILFRRMYPALPNTGSEADEPMKLTYIREVWEEGGEAQEVIVT